MGTNAHDKIRASLGAYALGALDEEETATIDQHLELCAACRSEVAELREAATRLVEPEGVPPADVWERVSTAIRDPLRRRPWLRRSHQGYG
ncbi:MAG: zf-HC2 domain-containing protein [Actinomycetota bacterium]|nr:zf-HC2 domain-containing protein [Actinomycetota bacterium]